MPMISSHGYEVNIFDQRGAPGKKTAKKDVGVTNEYLVFNDLDQIINELIIKPKYNGLFILWGHSMGGAIILNYGVKGTHRDRVDGFIASAPLVEVEPTTAPSKLMSMLLPLLAKFMPKYKQKVPNLKVENLTSDPEQIEKIKKDMNSTTSAEQMNDMLVRGKRLLNSIFVGKFVDRPVLVFHGYADKINDIFASKEFFKLLKVQDKSFVEYEGYYHELHHETKDRIEVYVKDVVGWLDKHEKTASAESLAAAGPVEAETLAPAEIEAQTQVRAQVEVPSAVKEESAEVANYSEVVKIVPEPEAEPEAEPAVEFVTEVVATEPLTIESVAEPVETVKTVPEPEAEPAVEFVTEPVAAETVAIESVAEPIKAEVREIVTEPVPLPLKEEVKKPEVKEPEVKEPEVKEPAPSVETAAEPSKDEIKEPEFTEEPETATESAKEVTKDHQPVQELERAAEEVSDPVEQPVVAAEAEMVPMADAEAVKESDGIKEPESTPVNEETSGETSDPTESKSEEPEDDEEDSGVLPAKPSVDNVKTSGGNKKNKKKKKKGKK